VIGIAPTTTAFDGESMSYNSLSIPLANGSWSCELVPVRDYRSASGGSLPFIQADEKRLLESDRSDFTRYFRPNYDFRRTVTYDIDEIRAFVRDCLGLSSRNQVTDNDSIRRILCEAVSSGRIVPVVNRERRTPVRTARASFAPQSWNEAVPIVRSGSGGSAASASRSFHQLAMDWMGLDSDGADAYIEKYNAMVERIEAVQARTAAARAAAVEASWAEGDLLAAEALGGAALGSNEDGAGGDDFTSDLTDDAATPLSDAQPFDYQPDMPDGDVEDLAGTTDEKYARKMYGYDSATFREMIHRFKRAFPVGANQDLEFEENGDVYFNGEYLDNFHGYGD
jgi:hypothetical protein